MVRVLFGIGGLASAAGIGRIIYTLMVAKYWDTTWEAYPIWLANRIELDLGMVLLPIHCFFFP
jgi:glycyl-tRNA synthetase (class II)